MWKAESIIAHVAGFPSVLPSVTAWVTATAVFWLARSLALPRFRSLIRFCVCFNPVLSLSSLAVSPCNVLPFPILHLYHVFSSSPPSPLISVCLDPPKLSDDLKETLEGPLTYEECKKIPEIFQNDKAPGEDGFTVDFYAYFFELLGNDLRENVPEDRVKSQKCGTCLKNWFPSSFAQRYPMMS